MINYMRRFFHVNCLISLNPILDIHSTSIWVTRTICAAAKTCRVSERVQWMSLGKVDSFNFLLLVCVHPIVRVKSTFKCRLRVGLRRLLGTTSFAARINGAFELHFRSWRELRGGRARCL